MIKRDHKPLLPTDTRKSGSAAVSCLESCAFLIGFALYVLATFLLTYYSWQYVFVACQSSQTFIHSSDLLNENCYTIASGQYYGFFAKLPAVLRYGDISKFDGQYEFHAMNRKIYYSVEPGKVLAGIFVAALIFIFAREYCCAKSSNFILWILGSYFSGFVIFLGYKVLCFLYYAYNYYQIECVKEFWMVENE